jgi:methionyl aminopeptidase
MTEYVTVDPSDRVEARNGVIKLHGPEGFEGMRRAGRLAAEILDALVPHVVPGVTTDEIDALVYRHMLDAGAVPATLGYRGYTKSCCTSINHVVCHGIPGERVLKDGDIVNIDVTPILDGWHGDTSRMYFVGDVPIKAKKLVDVTYECLMLGLEQARPGNRLGDVANAINMPKRTATASSATSAATASDGCSTTARRWSMPAAPAPAPSSGPACSSPSSR